MANPLPTSAVRRLTNAPTKGSIVEYRTKQQLAEGRYHTIARGSGLSPQHVSRVVNGKRGASFHVAARIALAAGVTLDQLYSFIVTRPTLVVKGRRTVRDIKKVSKFEKRVLRSYAATL